MLARNSAVPLNNLEPITSKFEAMKKHLAARNKTVKRVKIVISPEPLNWKTITLDPEVPARLYRRLRRLMITYRAHLDVCQQKDADYVVQEGRYQKDTTLDVYNLIIKECEKIGIKL